MSGALSSFFFSTAEVSLLSSDSSTANATHPSPATAFVTIGSSGLVQLTDSSPYPWLTGGLPSNYEVMATLNGGAVGGSSFSTWLNLGTDRTWSLNRSFIGTSNGSITLQIRPVGGGAVVTTGTVAFSATVS